MMQTNKKRNGKRRVALAAALVLMFTVFAGQGIFAEGEALDLTTSCTVTVKSPAVTEDAYSELADANVVLDVYQIAATKVLKGSDGYELSYLAPFTASKYNFQKIADAAIEAGKEVSAAEIDDYVQSLAQVVLDGESGVTPVVTGAKLDTPIALPENAPIADEAATCGGMYLIIAHGSDLTDYVKDTDGVLSTVANGKSRRYEFAPMLVTLPQKGETKIGTGSVAGNTEDESWSYDIGLGSTAAEGEWIYALEIAAKVGEGSAEGSLKITKVLPEFEHVDGNTARTDPATFVFDVKVSDTETEEVYYSDVVSITFTEAGSDSVVIENLPVGAQAEVTEVYSGNYKQASVVYSDDPFLIKEDDPSTDAEEMIEATFTNTYNDSWRGTGSVINSFTSNGTTWDWEHVENSAE